MARRKVEVFSLSFLDVICCGFGAVILLLVLTEVGEPVVFEKSRVELEGRVLELQRVSTDSNRELRFTLNSSAFGPGEYRIRLQGYTWRGDRVDAGWVRLVVK
jgi:hypothetical protein